MQMKDRIKEIQEYVQMSQQDFAACLEISAATLSGIYNGRSQPTIKTANAIHSSFPEQEICLLMVRRRKLKRLMLCLLFHKRTPFR